MDKISGILPSSPRVASVDLRDAAPVRPGTPSFGRPEGISSLKNNNQPAVKEAALPVNGMLAPSTEKSPGWKLRDEQKAQTAADMSAKFFMNNKQPALPVKETEPMPQLNALALTDSRNSKPSGFKTVGLEGVRASANERTAFDEGLDMEPILDTEPEERMQPQGLYPKGSFIDRTA